MPSHFRPHRTVSGRCVVTLIGCAGLLGARSAEASGEAPAADAPAVSIVYRGLAGCPDSAEFVEQVRARTTRLSRVDLVAGPGALSANNASASRERSLRVSVAFLAERDQVVGRLALDGRDWTSATREIRGTSCREVSAALALMTALAIDPAAAQALSAKTTLEPANAAGAESADPQKTQETAQNETLESDPVERRQRLVAGRRNARADEGQSASEGRGAVLDETPPARFVIGAGGATMGGIGPAMGWGAELFGQWHWRGDRTAPSIRIAAALMFAGSADLPPAAAAGVSDGGAVSANFTAGVGRIDGCPLGIGLGVRWTLSPCAGVELDVIRSAGRGASFPLTKLTPRLAVGASGRLTLLLTSRLVAELGAGALVPFDASTRYVFGGATNQQTPVYTVPKVAAAADLGVGWRLP